MAIRTPILPLFHQKGLKSSFLGQIDHFKILYYSKFNFRKKKPITKKNKETINAKRREMKVLLKENK
jgi:hypothetical protein